MSLTSLVTAAAQLPGEEPAVHPYMVGALTLAVLLILLAGLLTFGRGRDHS